MHARYASTSHITSKPLLLGSYNINYESEPKSNKVPLENSQNNRSSLYQSSQGLPVVEPKFHAYKTPPKSRGIVAQEILTPLKLRRPIANPREYSSNCYENSSFAGLPKDDTYRSGYASQLNASNHMSYIAGPSTYSKRSMGEVQGFMDEEMKKHEEELEKAAAKKLELEVRLTEHKKKTIAIKKILTNPHYIPKLSVNIVRQPQQQEKSQERPKSVTILVKKGKGKIANSEWNNEMWLNVSDDENKEEKEIISQSTVEEVAEKKSRRRAKTLQASKFIPNIKLLRESLSPEVQPSSKVLTNTSEKLLRRRLSSFRDDRSQESSVRQESKHSIVWTKMGEDFKTGNLQPKSRLRRRSDTSSYSGGVCRKLALHTHIVLPSDVNTVIKKDTRKTSTSTTEPRREETKSRIKSKSFRESPRPKEIHGNLTSPKDFLDDQHLETIASQTHRVEELGLVGSETDIQIIKDQQGGDSKPHSDTIEKGTSSEITGVLTKTDSLKGKTGTNLEDYWELKSKTPEPNGHLRLRAAVNKAIQNQTARNVKQKEIVFDKRLKQGDLKDALKIVFSMNKKAEVTVFKDKSAENIKNLKIPTSSKNVKEKKRLRYEIDTDRNSNISPYTKPINFRKDDTKAFLVTNDKKKRDLVLTPLKMRPTNKKTSLSPKRARSMPRITPLSVLEKVYL